jgi:Pectate lyase superfamily protein
MPTYISPQPKLQFLDNNGVPLSGGKVYTYAAGTTTPLTTYTDFTGNTANSNPVILDSRGECSIWLGTSSYKFKLTTSTDVEVWTVDNISVLTSSANITYVESGTGAVTQTVQSKLRLGYVYPEDFGAVGNGSTNDTTALQNAINTGRDVYLAAGKTYLHTVALSVTTSNQWVGGPGILKTSGAINSVNVGGSSVGVKLSLNFNSPGQSSGYAIYISNADRVTIERAYLYDAFGALYVEQANTVQLEWMWGIIRGPGIKWFGNAAKRSDILSINFCVLDPGPDYYGFEWDGNCHSLNVKYMGLVCGGSTSTQSSFGFIIQNTVGGYKSVTSGTIAGTTLTLTTAPSSPIVVGMIISGTGVTVGTTITGLINSTNYTVSTSQSVATTPITAVPAFFPAIGRVGQVEIDYAKSAAIRVLSGVDYDFVMPYVTGSVSDGLYVDSNIDSYNVRVSGGKFIGNGGYGINNTTAGILLMSGSVQLTNNTSGATNGNVWNLAPTQAVDDYFYLNLGGDKTLASGTSQINFYPNDYISHNRASPRKVRFYIGGVEVFTVGADSVDSLIPFKLKTYTVATLPGSPVKGWVAMVTDANATTFASTVAGGGSNNVPVYYDGTNWKIG